jgi:hypothetical protein
MMFATCFEPGLLILICVKLTVYTLYINTVYTTVFMVPGSIPCHWRFFPGHQTVPCTLGSTQPLKMSTRIFLEVKTAGV